MTALIAAVDLRYDGEVVCGDDPSPSGVIVVIITYAF